MEKKLSENDHKGGWHLCTIGYLKQRLLDEYRELVRRTEQRPLTKKARKEIAREAADVANFAMMIADRYGGLMPKRTAQ
jgi:hypothetical protein